MNVGSPFSTKPAEFLMASVLLFCVSRLVPAATLICSLAGWWMLSLCTTLIKAVAFDPDCLGL